MGRPVLTLGVEEGYRLWAESYDRTPNPLLALEERVLRIVLPEVHGKRVLDLGCGTGRWLQKLARLGPRLVLGVDLSPEMLVKARAHDGSDANVVCARCECLPFRNACADLIVCSFTVGYLPDLYAFTREVARVAAPSATVLISDFHPQANERGWRRSFRRGEQEIQVRSFVRSLDELGRPFADCGFQVQEVVEAALGEPERAIFAAAGRVELFAAAAEAGSAIFITRLQRPKTSGVRPRGKLCGSLHLAGARIAFGPTIAMAADLDIGAGKICRIESSGATRAGELDLAGRLILPGLINAHDHLEFNLFPRLGNGPYRNFLEWAEDIHRPDTSPVREHCAVAKNARLWWGGLKNLLSGVTTVCHHNPYDAMFERGFPVRVVNRYGWAHSIALSPDVAAAFASSPEDAPFVIHLAEGTSEQCEAEIFELDQLGALGPRTVIVHGVGLNERGHDLLGKRGAALVWCPSSNLFTLGATLPSPAVKTCARVALGTDSAISGAGDLLDEIRIARQLSVPPELLYRMVTTGAADVLRLGEGAGTIQEGGLADLIAIRDPGTAPASALCGLVLGDIELVLIGGEPRMISPDLAARWPVPLLHGMEEINIAGVRRLVHAPVAELLATARASIGPDVRLAGKSVTL